jgi:hypothetical protein
MGRLLIAVSILVVGLVTTTGGALLSVTAQEDGSSTAGHPLVGVWFVDRNIDDAADAPSLLVFHADGTMMEADPEGGVAVGVWEATGPDSANLTIIFQESGEDGALAVTVKARVILVVATDGATFSAEYTLEFVSPDGTSSGEIGPARASGERIAVEPMGTPVAPLSALMGEEDGTPAP